MRTLTLALLVSLAAIAPAAAKGPSPTHTVAGEVARKPPLKLTDEQKQHVVQAINGRNSLDKLPDGFTPAVGAKVPVQKTLPEHPLPQPLVRAIPVLKNYYYVQLADQVLIVDPMTKTVAEIVKR
jgi:hypothetical protein